MSWLDKLQGIAEFVATCVITLLVYTYQQQRKADLEKMADLVEGVRRMMNSEVANLTQDYARLMSELQRLHEKASDYADEQQKAIGRLSEVFVPRREMDLMMSESQKDRQNLRSEMNAHNLRLGDLERRRSVR